MRQLYLVLLTALLTGSAWAEQFSEDRWENIERLKVGQKIEVTTTEMRTVVGTYVSSSEAAVRLKGPQEEVSLMREQVFRVKTIGGKRKQNALLGSVVGAVAGLALGAVADYKDDVDGSDPGSNNGKLGGALVGAGAGAGIGSGASVRSAPVLSTRRMSDSTNPGLTRVTDTPLRASSWPRDSASARTANLLIA